MRFHRKYAEWMVGLFALVALLLVFGFIGLVGWSQGWFIRRAEFHARFSQPSGLKPGAEVLVGGLLAGRVTAVELQPDGGVKVTMAVSRNFLSHLHADSVARIEATSLVGGPAVYVTVGSADRAALDEGQFIPTGLSQHLGNVDLMSLLHSLDALAKATTDPKGPIMRIITRMDRLTARLDDPKLGLDSLLSRLDRAAASGEKLMRRLERLTAMLDDPDLKLGDLAKRIGRTVELSESVLAKFDRILADQAEGIPLEIKGRFEVFADLVPHLNQKLERAMKMLDRIEQVLTLASSPDSTLGAMLSDRKLYDGLQGLLEETRGLVKAAKSSSEDLAKATPELPGLMDEASYTLDEVERLLEVVKSHPLLGGDKASKVPPPYLPLQGTDAPYED